MDLGIEDKVALVLGGSGGIGQAVCYSLAREGARVVVAGRDAAKIDEVVRSIRRQGGTARAAVWDLADRELADSRVTEVESDWGTIDILFNNSGGPPPGAVSAQDPEVWLSHFTAMVLSVIATTDRVLPGMKDSRWGRIITSASSGVLVPIPNLGFSNTLRASLLAWSKTLAREVAALNITSNVVIPGRIATDRVHYLDRAKAKGLGKSIEEVRQESLSTIPMGRYGDPEEYAQVVAFLAGQTASYVTGSVVRVDGGLIASV